MLGLGIKGKGFHRYLCYKAVYSRWWEQMSYPVASESEGWRVGISLGLKQCSLRGGTNVHPPIEGLLELRMLPPAPSQRRGQECRRRLQPQQSMYTEQNSRAKALLSRMAVMDMELPRLIQGLEVSAASRGRSLQYSKTYERFPGLHHRWGWRLQHKFSDLWNSKS